MFTHGNECLQNQCLQRLPLVMYVMLTLSLTRSPI